MISYRQIWLRADRQRQMYEKMYTAAFKRMLNRWTEQIAEGVTDSNAWRYHEMVEVDVKPLQNLMEGLYTNVGSKFAQDAYRENKPKSEYSDVHKTSLSMARKYLKETPRHIIDAAIKKVDAMNIEGPTLDEYMDMNGFKADEYEPVDKWTIYMRSYVKQRLGDRITSIAENTAMQAKLIIREAAEQALNDGLGSMELARIIRDALNTEMIPMNTWRALRIARTEVIGASNRGSYVGAKELGVPMNKIWIATIDNRTRDTHAAVNGQSVDMSAPFNVGGVPMECPGDPDGLPEDIINCRCTLAYETKRW